MTAVEFVGHAARTYSRSHMSEQTPFIIQVLLILLAPILFAAGIYMLLGRLIHASGHPNLSPVRANWITKIFLLGDILCFLVQVMGAAKLVKPKTPEDIKNGENIILGGLVLQILIFGFFLVVSVVFHKRLRQQSLSSIKGLLEQNLWSLYVCSVLVMVRNIFRLIEYKSGQDGYLMRHEWPVFAFDVALMAIVMSISLSWYCGSLEPPEATVYSTHEAIPLRT